MPPSVTLPSKDDLRHDLRAARKAHVEALPDSMRALVFHRPPAPLLDLVPDGAVIGLYRENAYEAPATSYAKFFLEYGHEIALPRFAGGGAPMEFARFADPFEGEDLEEGPFGLMQPSSEAPSMQPAVLLVPLVGFTDDGERLGQGGGHYDRWLEAHPETVAIGMAWDCQKCDRLPVEAHDRRLHAVVTPTRFYGPFA